MTGQKMVLLIEDNEHLNHINKRALARAGYKTMSALTLSQARMHLKTHEPDVIILDIMLPDGSGVDFCREIRERTAAPILFLTSVSGYDQTLEGLAVGGDDYLVKPFDLTVLLAKVAAFLRRNEITERVRQHRILKKGSLTLDLSTLRAFVNERGIHLSQTEFSLLLLFLQNESKVLSSEEIYEKVWSRPMLEDDTALKNALSRLRKKISESGYQITAVRGSGYCLAEE